MSKTWNSSVKFRGREVEGRTARIVAASFVVVVCMVLLLAMIAILAIVAMFWKVTIYVIVLVVLADQLLKLSGRFGFFRITKEFGNVLIEAKLDKKAFRRHS